MSHNEIVPGKKKGKCGKDFEKELLELTDVGNTSWVMKNNNKNKKTIGNIYLVLQSL